jgi:hypothetical protein
MPGFREYQGRTLAPGWLRDPRDIGGAPRSFPEALGLVKDALSARTKEAVKARFPTIAPADALGAIGEERGIDRGATETEAAYRARLRAAWDQWRWAGTPYGLLLAFYYAGYAPSSGRVILQVQKGWQYELRTDFDPAVHGADEGLVRTNIGAVSLGGVPQMWSDFAVLFVPPILPAWSPTPPADASPEVNTIRTLIWRWKPAHARCTTLKVTPVDLWDFPIETYEPTTEIWDEAGVTTTWTPPTG